MPLQGPEVEGLDESGRRGGNRLFEKGRQENRKLTGCKGVNVSCDNCGLEGAVPN